MRKEQGGEPGDEVLHGQQRLSVFLRAEREFGVLCKEQPETRSAPSAGSGVSISKTPWEGQQ